MPFKSKSQQRWMFKNKPEMAKEWAEETPDMESLPEHKGDKVKKKPMTDEERIKKLTSSMKDDGYEEPKEENQANPSQLNMTTQENAENEEEHEEIEDDGMGYLGNEQPEVKPSLMGKKGLHITILMGKK